MDKAHDVSNVTVSGTILSFGADGSVYEVDLSRLSDRLANAAQQQRDRFELSPSGYGIHWPDVDEDLSINGLIRAGRQVSAAQMIQGRR